MSAKAKMPVIDMKGLSGSDAERKSIMAEIHKACSDWGFFQVVNHGVPEALLDRVTDLFKQYYQKTMDSEFQKSDVVEALKEAMVSGSKLEDVDWEVGFYLTHSQHKPTTEAPDLPTTLKETMDEFSEEIKLLAERLLQVMSENLGLPKTYLSRTLGGRQKEHYYGTKMCHYPPCPRPDLIDGLRSHTDAGGLIIVLQDAKVGGLEMFREEDGEWYDVKPMQHALVIDVGDQMEVITNGRYLSRWHRVKAVRDGNRMSVAAFCNPSPDAVIRPAPSLQMPSEESRASGDYPTFVSADYMKIYSLHKFVAKEKRFRALRETNLAISVASAVFTAAV